MTREEAKEKLYMEWQGFLENNIDYAGVSEAYKMAFKALDQEPCEDEYIKVPKKALKYRTAGMVAYNTEWLKNNFDIERVVICGTQEPILDKIRAEIQSLRNCSCSNSDGIIDDVEDILDKYKVGSEDKEDEKDFVCTYQETGCGSCKHQTNCPL